MRVTCTEIKRQQADVQLRQLKGETFPSETAGEFAAEEKKEDTEHNSEIQCIITRANQRYLCACQNFTQVKMITEL